MNYDVCRQIHSNIHGGIQKFAFKSLQTDKPECLQTDKLECLQTTLTAYFFDLGCVFSLKMAAGLSFWLGTRFPGSTIISTSVEPAIQK